MCNYNAKPLVVLLLAFCGLVLFGSQASAKPPSAREIVFGEDQDIKVQFDPNGDVAAVYFLDCVDGEGCCDQENPICWGEPAAAQPGVICTCFGTDCSENLQENLGNTSGLDLTLDCHLITNSGPKSTGCPLYGSRAYTNAGAAYTR